MANNDYNSIIFQYKLLHSQFNKYLIYNLYTGVIFNVK